MIRLFFNNQAKYIGPTSTKNTILINCGPASNMAFSKALLFTFLACICTVADGFLVSTPILASQRLLSQSSVRRCPHHSPVMMANGATRSLIKKFFTETLLRKKSESGNSASAEAAPEPNDQSRSEQSLDATQGQQSATTCFRSKFDEIKKERTEALTKKMLSTLQVKMQAYQRHLRMSSCIRLARLAYPPC